VPPPGKIKTAGLTPKPDGPEKKGSTKRQKGPAVEGEFDERRCGEEGAAPSQDLTTTWGSGVGREGKKKFRLAQGMVDLPRDEGTRSSLFERSIFDAERRGGGVTNDAWSGGVMKGIAAANGVKRIF